MKSREIPVEITFKFETVRNFTNVEFFASNDFQRSVKMFSVAKIFFSIGGLYYTKKPIIYQNAQDEDITFARKIPIQLYNSIGRYVKFQLFFEDKWILLGEVKFSSFEAAGTFKPEKPPLTAEPIIPRFTRSTQKTAVKDNEPNRIRNEFNYEFSSISPSTHLPGSAEFKQEYVGIVSGIVVAKIFIVLLLVIVIYYRRRRKKYSRQPSPVSSTKPLAPPTDLMNGMNKLPYNTLATSDVESEKEHCLYSEPEIVFMQRQHLPYFNISAKPPPSPPPFPKHFNICERNRQLVELERDNLKFLEKLGGGQFGEVHLCEVINKDCLNTEFHTEEEKFLVAVKTLNEHADETARKDFQRELAVMARLKDPNVVQVVGVITKEEPMCVATEYMIHGDMNQFLRQRVLDTAGTIARKGKKQLSYGCLIYMSTQVASGMKYLESLSLVHRDLACRNCLVGRHYSVKISDFGMSRNLYSGDYYRIEGKAVLPIRWMAWESILLGKFSSKSDVWSMGVTLWEMLTFAKEQPFTNMTDEEVIENCGHFYRGDGQEQYLPQPSLCPREIYDLMRECWNKDEVNRPSFSEIHMFLHRKNMGYRPREDEYPL
ncbi:DgyrCDS8084 [Dimorphilus gyrociliatus]|nr:DgyrCDS8084 [Dimorphilus gyrociliatus]